MTKPPLVLICAPHSDVKNYCINDWLRQVQNLSYPKDRYQIFVSDNSRKDTNTKWLRKQGIMADWVKPKGKSNIEYMAQSHEQCRKKAIAGGYDVMLHWETDLSAPPNIIERLLMARKKVVSGLYPIELGKQSKLLLQFREKDFETLLVTTNADHTDMNFIDGKVKPVFACGLGMALIRKEVFDVIPFRFEEGVKVHPDTIYAHDLQQAGIKQYVDTSILLKHNNREWIWK